MVRLKFSALLPWQMSFRSLCIYSVLMLTVQVPAVKAGYSATLEVEPNSANAGTQLIIRGSNHSSFDHTLIELRWGSEEGPLLGTVNPDDEGRYAASVVVPEGFAPGDYSIVACELENERCPVGSEFHIGARADFNLLALPTLPDLANFTSIVGNGRNGWFGEYRPIIDGFIPSFVIPRCSPPDDAHILDFDSDTTGRLPRVGGSTGVSIAFQKVERAPSETISPNQALYLESSVTTNRSPIVRFANGQRYVGLYIGNQTPDSGLIELIAFDNGGNVVAVDRLPEAEAPIMTCMALQSDTANIRSIQVRGVGDIYVDRLFYSPTGELTQPVVPARGTVEFIQPQLDEAISTRSRKLISGKIRVPLGLDIDEVLLTTPRWNRTSVDTRSISFGRLWDEGDETLYLFLSNDVYLPEGSTYISITAAGPGVIATGFIDVVGVGAPPLHQEDVDGLVDIEPITIEVTQAVRGVVPLINPGDVIDEPDSTILVRDKNTMVRGFARLRFPGGETFSGGSLPVSAELVGTRNGRALPGSPLSPVNDTVNVSLWTDRSAAYHNNKQETALAWNFDLPISWTSVGEIDLRLEVNPTSHRTHIVEHEDFDGELNVIGVDGVTFREQPLPSVVVWLVDYYFRCGPELVDGDPDTRRDGEGATRTPAEGFCRGASEGDIVNAKPSVWDAAREVLDWWNLSPFPKHYPDSFESYDYVFAAAEDPPIPEDDITGPMLSPGSPVGTDTLGIAFRGDVVVGTDGFGMMNVLLSSFVRGKAWGSPSFFRVTPNFATTAHEAGHTMGLRHTGNQHGEGWWIVRWRDDHGEIGRTREVVSGFDVLNMRAMPYEDRLRSCTNMNADWHCRHDFMSYGPNRWTSWDVWHHMEDAVGSNIARVDNRVDDHMGVFFEEIFGLGAPPGDQELITLSGSLKGDSLQLQPGFNLPGAVLVTAGDMRFQVIDNDSGRTYESASIVQQAYDSDSNEQSFIAGLYVPATADELVILHQDVEVYRSAITAAPTDVTLIAPTDWPAGETVTVNWNASGGSNLQHLLQISQDGQQWYTLARTDASSASLVVDNLPAAGPGWQLRVQSSSGIATTFSAPVTVNLPERQLQPFIVLPRPDSEVLANRYIHLQALNRRFAQGVEELQWWVNGEQLARGGGAQVIANPPGTMTIELRSPATGESHKIEITVVADSDLDGLPDTWEERWGFDAFNPEDQADDSDGDGLPAWGEYESGASPQAIDTDNDGYSDAVEAEVGTSPADVDSMPAVWIDGGPVPRLTNNGGSVPVRAVIVFLVFLLLLLALLWQTVARRPLV